MLCGNNLCVSYLLEVALHARHQHDAGHTNSQKQKKGVDEASHCRVVSARTATTQEAGGAAAQAWDLGGITQHLKQSIVKENKIVIYYMISGGSFSWTIDPDNHLQPHS